MSCPESVRTIKKCSCCDQCIQHKQKQNSKPDKNVLSQGYRVSKNKRSNNYRENYAVPDDKFRSKENFNSHRPCNQSKFIDEHVAKTLANLRQRAYQVLQTSDDTQLCKDDKAESDASPNRCCRNGGSAKYMEKLDYSPQSKFLRKMKRQSEEVKDTRDVQTQCECANCAPVGDYYQAQKFCPCLRCCSKDRRSQNAGYERPQTREPEVPFSDISSIHEPCSCFRTWRPNLYSGDIPQYQYELLDKEDDNCGGQVSTRDWAEEDDWECECEDGGRRKEERKSGHVSRLDKRKRRTGRRRNKQSPRPNESPGIDFSPSLKRPHPNSCERCWRFASPSRSPVNKPDQKYDPNFRRSHSQININGGRMGASSGASTDSRFYGNFETEVRDLLYSSPSSNSKIKSFHDIHKMKTSGPSAIMDKPEIKPRDLGGKPKRDGSGRPSPKNKTSKNTGVTFPERKVTERNQKSGPMQCSPSMFDKDNQKSDVSDRRRTSGPGAEKVNYSSNKERPASSYQAKAKCEDRHNVKKDKEKTEGSKQRPASAYQAQTSKGPNERRRSFERNRSRRNDNEDNSNGSRAKSYACTKPKPQPASEKERLRPDQPYVGQMGRDDFSGSRAKLSDNPHYFVRKSDKVYPGQHYENETRSFQGFDNSKLCKCCKIGSGCPRTKFSGEGSNTGQPGKKTPVADKKTGATKDGNDSRRNSKSRSDSQDKQMNPRKYCVFYMNKSKENKEFYDDDDVEVLIEEFTEGRGQDSKKDDDVKYKMSKMKEQRSDSMALRFQKGIAEKCKKPENNRYLYF